MDGDRLKLCTSLKNIKFFLNEVSEHARVSNYLSKPELKRMFKKARACENFCKNAQRNENLQPILTSLYGESVLTSLSSARKTLFLDILDNLRLSSEVLKETLEVYSSQCEDRSMEEEALVLEQHLKWVRPFWEYLLQNSQNDPNYRRKIEATLVLKNVLAFDPIEEKVFKNEASFITVLYILSASENSRYSKKFYFLPSGVSELAASFNFIVKSVNLYVEAAEKHECLCAFAVKLCNNVIQKWKTEVIKLLAELLSISSNHMSDRLLHHINNYEIRGYKEEIMAILIDE